MYWFDSTIVILIPALILSFWAQAKIKSTYAKYSKVKSSLGYTGEMTARALLDSHGLSNIPVEVIAGNLTDHYDPKAKAMRLSKDVFYGNSVASIGIAAHETGHAIQDSEDYIPLRFRSALVPVANFGSKFSWILLMLGFFLGLNGVGNTLFSFGILLFTAVVLFQVVTLPVEFNASSRAIHEIEDRGILMNDEIKGAKKVLSAAALTYVAAVLMSLAQLLRLLVLSNRRN